MTRSSAHYFNRRAVFPMIFDFGFVMLALVGVFFVYAGASDHVASLTATHGLSLATGTFVINIASGFYQPWRERTLQELIARAAVASLLALPLAYSLFRLVPDELRNAADLMAISAMAAVLGIIVLRACVAYASRPSRSRTRVLIVGAGHAAQQVGQALESDPHSDIVGYFPGSNDGEASVEASKILSGMPLAATAIKANASEIVIALTERRGGAISLRDLIDCRVHGIRVSDLSTYFERILRQIKLDFVKPGWLIYGGGFDQRVARTVAKRVFDVVCSVLILFAAAPLILMTAALIKLDSRGPLLYRQKRVGLWGSTFDVIKFRSMRADAEKDGKPKWASAADDRVTRVGRIIRKLRIDELPQLVNVLKGEMSLVGPRPERPFFVDKLTADIPYYAIRHSVKPGVTGWAQVRYDYGATVEDSLQKLQFDLYYVKNHSLYLDLVILAETVVVVLTGRGAR